MELWTCILGVVLGLFLGPIIYPVVSIIGYARRTKDIENRITALRQDHTRYINDTKKKYQKLNKKYLRLREKIIKLVDSATAQQIEPHIPKEGREVK